MYGGAVRSLDRKRGSDSEECERLGRRLFVMVEKWEGLIARKSELERQFIENDLRVQRGVHCGLSLSRKGRRRRMAQLLELQESARDLERAMSWVERRRTYLLRSIFTSA